MLLTRLLGQTLVALSRAIAPFIGGSVLSWGISGKHSFPFNSYFPFLLISVPTVGTLFLTYWLPASLDTPLKSIVVLNKEGDEVSDEEKVDETLSSSSLDDISPEITGKD